MLKLYYSAMDIYYLITNARDICEILHGLVYENKNGSFLLFSHSCFIEYRIGDKAHSECM